MSTEPQASSRSAGPPPTRDNGLSVGPYGDGGFLLEVPLTLVVYFAEVEEGNWRITVEASCAAEFGVRSVTRPLGEESPM